MGFLDTIKERLRGGADDDYYEDDYYDDGYEEGGYSGGSAPASRRRDPGSSPRVLGTTPRPEAESVSVYTRSGRPLSAERTQQTAPVTSRSYGASEGDYPAPTPGDLGPRTVTRLSGSGQLPPYVLKPVSYDDVQTVVRRVRTNQPVVIVFRNTNTETAKRILDFCFGFSYGIGGEIEELGERVFAVTPAGLTLSKADIDKLVADGDLTR